MSLSVDEWVPSDDVQLDAKALAIVKAEGNAAIVAGPGAGKTELLAQRASFLLETDVCPAPKRILAISFKRDASRNLRSRVQQRVGENLAGRFESYTFDAFAKTLVDRFLNGLPGWCRPSRDYRIAFPAFQEWQSFAYDFGLNGQQLQAAVSNLGLGGGLPLHEMMPSEAAGKAALAWWRFALDQEQSRLTFNMVNVLAMTILKHNPHVVEALRRTYSHVFLDEFQDTTGLQYALVEASFRESQVVLTAVGDTKQRIMTWAGALPGNFESFIVDFDADRQALSSNFRSTKRIVEIVNTMAKLIEPDAVEVSAARTDAPHTETDGILNFGSSHEEAAHLADWVARTIEGGRAASDFLFLVRQFADSAEEVLQPSFAERGLNLRNEARKMDGGVAIQELMTEPLSDMVVAVLQLAVNDRTDAPYQRLWDALADAYDLDEDRAEPALKLEAKILQLVNMVRKLIGQQPAPAEVNFAALVSELCSALPTIALQQLAPDYEDEARLNGVMVSIADLLDECRVAPNWQELIDGYLGRDQARLMTVHKSKGLEAHTVVFLHLQNNAFHSSFNEADEKYTFFVAASRARDRLYITATSPQRDRVAPLWKMVQAAGMKQVYPISSAAN